MPKTSSRTVRKATKTSTTATAAARPRTKPASASSSRRATAETARRDGADAGHDGPDFTRSTFWRVVMIHKALQNEEKFSSDTMAEKLEVSSRTITRDIKLMQGLLGMPVEWDPGEHSFFYTRPCDTLPLLCLSRREALVFAVIAHVVNGWLGAALGSELDGIMKKIAPAFGGAVNLDPDSLQRVLTLPDAGDLRELDHFLPLLEALLAHEQVLLDYRKSPNHPVERRQVDPLQLALQEGAWLLVTHDHAREDVRRFLLTRIRAVTRTGSTFSPPRDFDVKKYLHDSLGLYGGTEEHEVRLALDAHAANYAREKAWHPSQQLTERPDGGVELKLRLNHLAGAKHLALNWAEHVEVLSPPALRDEVRESLAAALAKYGGARAAKPQQEVRGQESEVRMGLP